ncbi:YchJ family metal-binding protein [Nocardioides sp. 616]|uniref:YchJ family protein n=1 Tax=Nocardioides sp. 616 TaxID=2268090 RepID=UPI000CE37824|nr:YchJ family metal-binding protein [Nocardioides sp. 616]
MLDRECPCGAARGYDACCGRLHRGAARAETAEELMRARYSAFALGQENFLFASWHPATRPEDVSVDPTTRWTGLEVVECLDGGPDDAVGVVEFVAHFTGGSLRERSRFERRAGRWVYLDGAGPGTSRAPGGAPAA